VTLHGLSRMYIKLNLNDRFWYPAAVAMKFTVTDCCVRYMTSCTFVFMYTFRRKLLAYVCRRWLAGIAGLNLAGDMDVCALLGRGLCSGRITRPEEFYRVCR
jgi:hypothetical protein